MEAEERRPPPPSSPLLPLLREDWQGTCALNVHLVLFSFVTFGYPATSRPWASASSNPVSAAFVLPPLAPSFFFPS